MATQKLENYLRTFRKRSGLTQREVAFLLGCRNGTHVSHYEKRQRLPTLKTSLACELVFQAPVSELFPGLRVSVGKEVEKRKTELTAKLREDSSAGKVTPLTAQKLRWLTMLSTGCATNNTFKP